MLGTEHLGMGSHPTTQEDGRRGGDLTGVRGVRKALLNLLYAGKARGKAGDQRGVGGQKQQLEKIWRGRRRHLRFYNHRQRRCGKGEVATTKKVGGYNP